MAFTRIHNFRDYGGYRVAGGGRVRDGLLYRSGHPASAGEDDRARFAQLGIRTIVDMRGVSERARYPADWLRGEGMAWVAHDGETRNDPVNASVEPSAITIEQFHTRKRAIYARMVHNPAMVAIFARYLEAVSHGSGASLVHCFAGEGRTGVGVALLQHALGVHRDDIVAEYMKTNDGETFGFLREQIEARVRRRHPDIDEETLAVTMRVDPSYLASAFAAIERADGSIDDYLARRIGVDRAMTDRLRARLVE